MSLEELLKNEIIAKTKPHKKAALNCLKLAERDLKTAAKIVTENDFDWTLSIAYNAMLQAGRGLMFLKGYRPSGIFKHLAVARFLSACGKDVGEEIVMVFDKMRKRRHIAVYDSAGTVSESEANAALQKANELVIKIKQIIQKHDAMPLRSVRKKKG